MRDVGELVDQHLKAAERAESGSGTWCTYCASGLACPARDLADLLVIARRELKARDHDIAVLKDTVVVQAVALAGPRETK